MPQFLYRIEPTRAAMLTDGPTPREAAVVGEHFQYLQRLLAQGVVLMAGRTLATDARGFGIVVFVAASEAAAAQVMRSDPAVAQRIMRAELFPYRIALWAPAGPATSDGGDA
jgi:uncharacterized protein YciI